VRGVTDHAAAGWSAPAGRVTGLNPGRRDPEVPGMTPWQPGPPQTYPTAAPRTLPSSLIWVGRLLLLLAALQVLAALVVLLGSNGDAAYRAGGAVGVLAVAVLLIAAGQRLEKAGPRRFRGIVAVGVLQILVGLGRVGNQDASGLLVAVLGIAVLVLVTRPPARAFLRGH
jgi:hypothetical protein